MSIEVSEPIPRLYALHRDDDEDSPPTVVAWGLAFADGSAVTLWTDPYPGAAVARGRMCNVEALYARYSDAYLTWMTGTYAETVRQERVDAPIREGDLCVPQ